jgi:hypothetical protein
MSPNRRPAYHEKTSDDFGPVFAQAPGSRLRYYPWTLTAFLFWLGYIAGMIYLLNHVSQNSPVESEDRWRVQEVAAQVMSVFFAQAHVPITAAYLARLAISALHNPDTAPRTWTELFWLADRSWQGPVSIGNTYLSMFKRRVRPSVTFVSFSIASLSAVVTPILLSRAWPSATVQVLVPQLIPSNTFSPGSINNIDSSSQMGTGEGAWTSGLSVFDVYNASTFVNWTETFWEPDDSSIRDYMFSGDVQGFNVHAMPGVWVNGSCWVVSAPPLVDDSDDALFDWCNANGWDQYFSSTVLQSEWNITLAIRWCSDYFANATYNYDWMNVAPSSPASVIVHVNGTGPMNSTDFNNNGQVDGFIQCDSTFATGTANIHGEDQAFTHFQQKNYFDANVEREDIPYHPLYAALYSITQTFGDDNDTNADGTPSDVGNERVDSILRMLGYQAQYDSASGDGEITFVQANTSTIASHLWTGTSHMAAAIGLLSRDTMTFNATTFQSVSGRDRDTRFVAIAAGALGVWLATLLYCTFRMYRPTFGGSLNAYAAARLLADWPHLVDGHCCGDLEENAFLRTGFGHVGDTRPDEPIGHVGVAMGAIEGKLDTKRPYRGASSIYERSVRTRIVASGKQAQT